MAHATCVSLETYLQTSYCPDCDYLDGQVRERITGEVRHGWMLGTFINLFARHEPEWRLIALPTVRVQITSSRIRVPDIVVLFPEQMHGRIVRSVPTGCIEVFSSEEPMENMQERVADYARMGVRAIWVVDPWRRVVYNASNDGKLTTEETALTIPGTPVRVTVDETFAELDRLGQKA